MTFCLGKTARRLKLYSLRTLGQLAALPRAALIEQLGKPGGITHRLASGEDNRRIAKYQSEADQSRFKQALGNLVSNAIKYSPANTLVQLWTECYEHSSRFMWPIKGQAFP